MIRHLGSGEMLDVKLNVQQEFHSRLFSFFQNAITPHTGNSRYHKAQGRNGGTGAVPSSSCPCFVFHVQLMEFYRAKTHEKFLHECFPDQGLFRARRAGRYQYGNQVNRRGCVPLGASSFIVVVVERYPKYSNIRIFSPTGRSQKPGERPSLRERFFSLLSPST